MPDLLILGLSGVGKTALATALQKAGCTAAIFEQVNAHEGGDPKVLVDGKVRQASAVCRIERVNIHMVKALTGDSATLHLTCVRNGLLVPTAMRFTLSEVLDPEWATWSARAAEAILGLFPDLREFRYDPKAILRASLLHRCDVEGEAGSCFHRPDGALVTTGEMVRLLDQNHPDAMAFLEDVTGAAVRVVRVRERFGVLQGPNEVRAVLKSIDPGASGGTTLGVKLDTKEEESQALRRLAKELDAGVCRMARERDQAHARISELEATLANERGEGEGPSEGWAWISGVRNDPARAESFNDRRGWLHEEQRKEVRPALEHPPGLPWWWGVEIVGNWRSDPQGFALTARHAMRAADAAFEAAK